MRLEEASTLLWPELPAAGDGKSQPLPVCGEVAKRGWARVVRVPNRVLREIGTYATIERANVVSHTASRPGDDGEIFAWDARGCVVQRDGRRVRVPFAKMTARTRRSLWRIDDTGRREPLVMWLAEGGRPVGDRAWEATLAAEAGVSRSTANRASQVLRDLEQLRQHAGMVPPPSKSDTDKGGLRKEIADAKRANNKAVKVLEGSIDILAQHVQVLTLDNERLRKALEAKHATVVPMRGGTPGPTLVE